VIKLLHPASGQLLGALHLASARDPDVTADVQISQHERRVEQYRK